LGIDLGTTNSLVAVYEQGEPRVLTPEGECHIVFDDGNKAATNALEAAFEARQITPDLMIAAAGKIAPWLASVTFGGPDLRTVYLGSLRGTRVPYFRAPVAGLPMVHW